MFALEFMVFFVYLKVAQVYVNLCFCTMPLKAVQRKLTYWTRAI